MKNKKKKLNYDITAIILTYNEEKHIERCINSIKRYTKKIIVIDSFSNDKTIKIRSITFHGHSTDQSIRTYSLDRVVPAQDEVNIKNNEETFNVYDIFHFRNLKKKKGLYLTVQYPKSLE